MCLCDITLCIWISIAYYTVKHKCIHIIVFHRKSYRNIPTHQMLSSKQNGSFIPLFAIYCLLYFIVCVYLLFLAISCHFSLFTLRYLRASILHEHTHSSASPWQWKFSMLQAAQAHKQHTTQQKDCVTTMVLHKRNWKWFLRENS